MNATPKTLKLLRVLIEKRGHVVEKADLLEAVWDNSFVEEINIAFTVNLLRKVLDDDAKKPCFIQTVPRRGYRFIGEVDEGPEQLRTVESSNPTNGTRSLAGRLVVSATVSGLLLLGALLVISWYVGHTAADLPILTSPFRLEKLSTNGEVSHAVISPDGKLGAYVSGVGHDKESVWLKQLDNADSIQLIQPSADFYGGLEFSNDSKFLYFARGPQNRSPDKQFDIYRMSVFGGVPEKILDSAQGWISLSPDGSKMSFVRCDYRKEEYCSLWIADSLNGQNERKIISRPSPFRIGVNRFSPDGRSIAFAAGQSESGANDFGVEEIDLENGTLRDLAVEKFFDITGIAWLPDQSGLLLTTWKSTERNGRIWLVSNASGEVRPLTKDSETYSGLSVDQKAGLLTSTQVSVDFHIHLFRWSDVAEDRVLAEAVNVVFAPDGRIVFTSAMNGNDEIWSVNPDGSDQRQLTKDEGGNGSPIVSPDDRYIYYSSNRTDSAQIWRINRDGTNPIQVTRTEGGIPLSASPDGKWIYYQNGRNRTLWRVSASGGEEQPVLNAPQHQFAISPDGLKVAFADATGLRVTSLVNGSPVRPFDVVAKPTQILQLSWTPDGNELAYIARDDSGVYLNFQPENGIPTHNRINLGTQGVYEQSSLAFAPDGKTVAIVQGGWKKDGVLIKGLK